MLSLHTNSSALNIQKNLGNTQSRLGNSMTRLGTGYRINAAKDDAAGLQIATRLKAQTGGMKVAQTNAQNANSMLQTAEGAFSEMSNILMRMKELATQAADGSQGKADRDALQTEYNALGSELANIVNNTSYGNEKLFAAAPSGGTTPGGKLTAAVTFQIGATAGETYAFDVSAGLTTLSTSLNAASGSFAAAGTGGGTGGGGAAPTTAEFDTGASANGKLNDLDTALANIGAIRSQLGGAQNRLEHTVNNLGNMIGNTTDATGRIMDVDYAAESAQMTAQQILMQASTSMLKQSSAMNQMVLSLVQ